tara:strand:- start:7261 stop:7614 length:354 start_codon:yes stop_codon:yes gene_type:complete
MYTINQVWRDAREDGSSTFVKAMGKDPAFVLNKTFKVYIKDEELKVYKCTSEHYQEQDASVFLKYGWHKAIILTYLNACTERLDVMIDSMQNGLREESVHPRIKKLINNYNEKIKSL